jgi:hypothetical protein
MATVSTYLNFPRSTEQAFVFYRSVFGGDFTGPIRRFGEIPLSLASRTSPPKTRVSSCTSNSPS